MIDKVIRLLENNLNDNIKTLNKNLKTLSTKIKIISIRNIEIQ